MEKHISENLKKVIKIGAIAIGSIAVIVIGIALEKAINPYKFEFKIQKTGEGV